jgi:UDP-galactopyranose mutase
MKFCKQSKQAKLQWLQDPSEISGNNLNSVASRYNMNKERKYLKDKINELPTSSANKNIRDLYRGRNEINISEG